MTDATTPPTLFEWAGGAEALDRLTAHFYDKVLRDPLLRPVFDHMSLDHPHHVALFIGEVFGGPKAYSDAHGGHAEMVTHHLRRGLTEEQRGQWMRLLCQSADEVGLPSDPEFRSAFVGYLEWGSRLAVINSQEGAAAPPDDSPMPKWGWGEVGGPYQG